ncbi:hypothetical protein EVA_14195 [gut metagenome]|uniref:Uncharacterized protein n=1 Tax=gut metagenome TaxID=749906 RepID=J9G7E7_9ZZZZ
MFLQTVNVRFEIAVTVSICFGIDIVDKGSERHLRVDDKFPTAVKMQNDVRT